MLICVDVSDTAREMSADVAKLAEHELDAAVMGIVRRSEKRIVVLLGLSTDVGIVHFERAAPADVAIA